MSNKTWNGSVGQGTVQFPGGRYEHRYPGGHVRTHKSIYQSKDFSNVIVGGVIVIGTGLATVVIMADNAFGIGVAASEYMSLFATFDVSEVW